MREIVSSKNCVLSILLSELHTLKTQNFLLLLLVFDLVHSKLQEQNVFANLAVRHVIGHAINFCVYTAKTFNSFDLLGVFPAL